MTESQAPGIWSCGPSCHSEQGVHYLSGKASGTHTWVLMLNTQTTELDGPTRPFIRPFSVQGTWGPLGSILLPSSY